MFSRFFGGRKEEVKKPKVPLELSSNSASPSNPSAGKRLSARFVSRRGPGPSNPRPAVRRGSAEPRPQDIDENAGERNLLQLAKSLPTESTLLRRSHDTDSAEPLSLRDESEPRLGTSMPELNVLLGVEEPDEETRINQTILCGFLWKQGGKRKNWHRRWFKLTENALFYFKNSMTNEPLGFITDLHTCGLRSCDSKTRRPFSFEIYTISRVYRIAAESNTEYLRWINYLRGCMSAGNHIIFNPDTRSFEELKLVFRDNISISDPDFSDHINETRATMTSDIFTTGDDSTSSEEDEQDLTEVDDDDDDDDEEEDINIEVEGTSGLGEEGGLSATDLRQHARNRSNTFKKERPLSLPLQNAFVDQRLARGLLPEVDSPLFEASKTFVSIGVLKQGYLTKLGAIVKNWKRRWCVLIDEHLNYYKTPKHNIPCGTVHIDASTYIERQTVLPSDRFPSIFCFKIVTAHRVYLFCSDSNADLKDWLQVLSQIELNRQLARYKRRL